MIRLLYTISLHEPDGSGVTYQVEAADEAESLRMWAKRYRPDAADFTVEFAGSEMGDLPLPTHGVLTVTPMEGLRNVWYFYGPLDDTLITGHIVATA